MNNKSSLIVASLLSCSVFYAMEERIIEQHERAHKRVDLAFQSYLLANGYWQCPLLKSTDRRLLDIEKEQVLLKIDSAPLESHESIIVTFEKDLKDRTRFNEEAKYF